MILRIEGSNLLGMCISITTRLVLRSLAFRRARLTQLAAGKFSSLRHAIRQQKEYWNKYPDDEQKTNTNHHIKWLHSYFPFITTISQAMISYNRRTA